MNKADKFAALYVAAVELRLAMRAREPLATKALALDLALEAIDEEDL